MHIGQDTEFYLAKGFRVVAVEANPQIAKQAMERFAGAIAAGRLTLINAGLAHQRGEMPFYINKDISERSSFNLAMATRLGEAVETIMVRTIPISLLLEEYGVPHYAKIDIEGHDADVLVGFMGWPEKPPYISYEGPTEWMFNRLLEGGYSRFKIVPQSPYTGASGPFGEETVGPWLSTEEMMAEVVKAEKAQVENQKTSTFPEWFDMHAGL